MLDLVGNPENWFSQNEAHICIYRILVGYSSGVSTKLQLKAAVAPIFPIMVNAVAAAIIDVLSSVNINPFMTNGLSHRYHLDESTSF